jgi:predicted aspartyl protease
MPALRKLGAASLKRSLTFFCAVIAQSLIVSACATGIDRPSVKSTEPRLTLFLDRNSAVGSPDGFEVRISGRLSGNLNDRYPLDQFIAPGHHRVTVGPQEAGVWYEFDASRGETVILAVVCAPGDCAKARLQRATEAQLSARRVPIANEPNSFRTLAPTKSVLGVRMKLVGGTYKVPVIINGAIALDFVVDSGAADVAIPADVVLTLIRAGTVSAGDFLGTRTYRLADGSTVPSSTFRIRSLKVGDRIVQNVTASVTDVRGELLLGQSFLGRFKSWSIDNATHSLLLQ